jgi:metacaspase-1
MRALILIVVLLMLIGGRSQAVQAEQYAICIGVNHSPDFRLASGQPPRPLRGAESDARQFANLLTNRFDYHSDRVRLLLGEQATRQAIQQALENISRVCAPDDRVVFYFAGHGTQVKDRLPLDEQDQLDEALCCHDVQSDGSNVVLDDELGRWLDDLPAAAVTVILDCCHAGTGTKDPGDDVGVRSLPMAEVQRAQAAGNAWDELQPVVKSTRHQRRMALFACQPYQQAYERRFPGQQPAERSGQLTFHLLAGIQRSAADADQDGQFSATEVWSFVQQQLQSSFNEVRATSADRQEPALEQVGGEGLLLGLRRP